MFALNLFHRVGMKEVIERDSLEVLCVVAEVVFSTATKTELCYLYPVQLHV